MQNTNTTMNDLYKRIRKFTKEYGKEPTHIYMDDKAFHSLCDELKFFPMFEDGKSDGKNYFMGVEIVLTGADDFVGLA